MLSKFIDKDVSFRQIIISDEILFLLILRVFISFTKQFFTSHSTLLEWNVKNCFVKLIKTLNISNRV